MGDYGLIGVIFCRLPEPAVWEVDTWLMSCRVLGRNTENYMFDRLVEAAQERGIREIRGLFRRTEKNILVEEHYDRLGFQRTSEGEAEKRYYLAVPNGVIRTATHVKDLTRQPLSANES